MPDATLVIVNSVGVRRSYRVSDSKVMERAVSAVNNAYGMTPKSVEIVWPGGQVEKIH